MAKRLKPGDPVAIIEGAAMKAGRMTIVTWQMARWETNEANKVVGAILPRHP